MPFLFAGAAVALGLIGRDVGAGAPIFELLA
jgi:hypothetical protein